MPALKKSLTFVQGTALMLNIVLGAGLLVLPGLAIKQVGEEAFVLWCVSAMVSFPLLLVFILLGKRYPDARGVAHFVGMVWGKKAYAVASFVFLGAVLFGLPSIALTGGHYLEQLSGVSPHSGGAVLLIVAALIQWFSSVWAARINTVLAWGVLVFVLFLIALLFLSPGGGVAPSVLSIWPLKGAWSGYLPTFFMLFFAFTGWEVAASLSEEFKRPAKDFPRAMSASFFLVTALYLMLAWGVQRSGLEKDFEAPFAALLKKVYGESGSRLISFGALAVIIPNLSSALWAVSRLVYALAREGILPESLQETRAGLPHSALRWTLFSLLLVLGGDACFSIGIENLLGLSAQNFLALYGMTALVLLMRSKRFSERCVAVFGFLLVAILSLLHGWKFLYPVALAVSAWGWQAYREKSKPS